MKFIQEFNPMVSYELTKFIADMHARGCNPRFQIQDVQEALLDDTDPLSNEARALRAKHGNFWIIFGRIG